MLHLCYCWLQLLAHQREGSPHVRHNINMYHRKGQTSHLQIGFTAVDETSLGETTISVQREGLGLFSVQQNS